MEASLAKGNIVEVVKANLTASGLLHKLKAEVRCEVMNVLGLSGLQGETKPPLAQEIQLLNSLISEYFKWCGYCYSDCVFEAETFNEDPLPRLEMEARLSLRTEDPSVPLLYLMLAHFGKTMKSAGNS